MHQSRECTNMAPIVYNGNQRLNTQKQYSSQHHDPAMNDNIRSFPSYGLIYHRDGGELISISHFPRPKRYPMCHSPVYIREWHRYKQEIWRVTWPQSLYLRGEGGWLWKKVQWRQLLFTITWLVYSRYYLMFCYFVSLLFIYSQYVREGDCKAVQWRQPRSTAM